MKPGNITVTLNELSSSLKTFIDAEVKGLIPCVALKPCFHELFWANELGFLKRNMVRDKQTRRWDGERRSGTTVHNVCCSVAIKHFVNWLWFTKTRVIILNMLLVTTKLTRQETVAACFTWTCSCECAWSFEHRWQTDRWTQTGVCLFSNTHTLTVSAVCWAASTSTHCGGTFCLSFKTSAVPLARFTLFSEEPANTNKLRNVRRRRRWKNHKRARKHQQTDC